MATKKATKKATKRLATKEPARQAAPVPNPGQRQGAAPRPPRGQRLPIDFFFRSLAQDQRERAVGVILSGTGSDGTQGARAIKAEGGLLLAQDSRSAGFDGMPGSVIATGLVDFVLPPEEMAAKLIGYAAHAFWSPPRPKVGPTPETGSALKRILVLLRSQTSHDFSQYKPGTTQRRIERRMALHQVQGLDAYLKLLQQTPAEVEALFRDLLIGVTSFFRDPAAFAALEEKALPALFKNKGEGSALRVWSAGCSTGEEAYSLAMLLAEHLDKASEKDKGLKLSVFATDIDAQAIASARAGLFPASIAADLSPERLARFFTLEAETGRYRVRKHLRDLLVFSEQDVNRDPPFSKLDLISCRNLLIYLGPELQERLMPLFHFALAPHGYLLLGTSETVGDHADLFEAVDRKQKLYRRKHNSLRARPGLGRAFQPSAPPPIELPPPAAVKLAGKFPPLRELAERALLHALAPAGALVNAQDDLQATVEELETTNEELKSSNEEMQSVNEELQSTNEEMETSKEELQSVNEEMATVNHELQAKVAQLSRSNNDMVNLMAGTGIATVFVDPQLEVQRFTPAATQLINLIPMDVGRTLGHIVSNLLLYDRLIEDVTAVLETLIPQEIEVQTKAEVWFQLRIRPYRTVDNQIEGAVITFTDITEIKRLRRALEELKAVPAKEPANG